MNEELDRFIEWAKTSADDRSRGSGFTVTSIMDFGLYRYWTRLREGDEEFKAFVEAELSILYKHPIIKWLLVAVIVRKSVGDKLYFEFVNKFGGPMWNDITKKKKKLEEKAPKRCTCHDDEPGGHYTSCPLYEDPTKKTTVKLVMPRRYGGSIEHRDLQRPGPYTGVFASRNLPPCIHATSGTRCICEQVR